MFENDLNRTYKSESESLEEESDISSFFVGFETWQVPIGFTETLSEFLSKLDSVLSFQVVFLDVLEVEIVDHEPGWDDMVLVDCFDECFDSSLLDELFLIDFSLNPLRVSGDASHDHMWEFVFLSYGLYTLFPS